MEDAVLCNDCNAILEEYSGTRPEERGPCPNCGSRARKFLIRLSGVIHARSSMRAELTVSTHASLLLQTVIVPGIKVDEGQIIEAVALPWFEIIEHLKKDPAVAYDIPYRMWEEIVAGAYKRAGFDEVILTQRTGDHGRDVIAIKKGLGLIRVIDQVKAYKPGHLVTADDVRALIGVLHGDGASKGFLTTTSDFAPKLKDDPLISPFIPSRLDLINGKLLFNRLEELSTKNPV